MKILVSFSGGKDSQACLIKACNEGRIIGAVQGGVRGYCYDVVYPRPIKGETDWSLYGIVVNDYGGKVVVAGNIYENPEIKEENKMYLRTAIKQAETDANRLSFSLQEIERRLIFHGFREDDLPQVTICNGDEIILVYKGNEIDAPTFIEIMEDNGYITKEDFINPYRIKHKPTGLYYQPINNGNSLSKHGKVYLTKANPLSQNYGRDYIWIQFNEYSRIYKEYSKYFPDMKDNGTSGISCRVPKSEFEVEYLKITDYDNAERNR